MVLLLAVGCTEPERSDCQVEADRICREIGYSDGLCPIALSAHCSEEDAEIARQICVDMHDLPADADCVIEWR